MEQMRIWCESENEHIRRLASEGCRTRLPWAVGLPQFKENPAPVIEVIKLLIDDPSEYVRRSVGNSLNDISKDNPEIVKSLTESLMNTEREHTLKQGLRTLLKSGDREALSLFGFEKRSDIRVEEFEVDKEVKLGTSLRFSFTLKSEESLDRVRVEYVIEYLRKNGTHHGKVFKISEFKTDKKEKSYCRQHSFKVVSTRRYYGGTHKVSIIINGELLSTKEFTLTS
jgi:3-methyladenine DNA glycosylase AlkC